MVSHSLSILDSHPLHDRLTLSFRVGQRHSLQPATLWALLTTDQPHTQDVTDAQRERRLGVNSMAPIVDAISSWCSAWPMRQLSAFAFLESKGLSYPLCCKQVNWPWRWRGFASKFKVPFISDHFMCGTPMKRWHPHVPLQPEAKSIHSESDFWLHKMHVPRSHLSVLHKSLHLLFPVPLERHYMFCVPLTRSLGIGLHFPVLKRKLLIFVVN
jgi:hypothetical protein